jgi:hypothetical protein
MGPPTDFTNDFFIKTVIEGKPSVNAFDISGARSMNLVTIFFIIKTITKGKP